jgi:hypothetical protein
MFLCFYDGGGGGGGANSIQLRSSVDLGQRKVLYVCLRRKLTEDFKVAQLAGAVASKAAYD